MLDAGYDKQLSIGTIASAGTLGILIPPAIMNVVMAEMLNTSAGTLVRRSDHARLRAVGPLSRSISSSSRSYQPDKAPKMRPRAPAEIASEFWRVMWTGLFPMTLLMVIVMGSILAGWATATESAGVGVLGAVLIAAINKQLSFKMMNEAIQSACRANAMVFLIFLGATCFSYVFRHLGGDDLMISALH